MRNNTFSIENKTYKQIQKRTAKKLFHAGNTILIIPCNANPNYILARFYAFMEKKEIQENYSYSAKDCFDLFVNEFENYNCIPELGKYANFYILKEG